MKNEKIYMIKSGDTTVEFRYSSGNDRYPLTATRLKLRGEQYQDLCTMTEKEAVYWKEWLQLRDIKSEVFKHFGNHRLKILEALT
jgi:hypothetical protein